MRISDWSSDVCSSDLTSLNIRKKMEESFAGMRMRRRDRLRFRRFTLAQENRQQNQHSGRKKLALPVLERLKPELWIAEIGHRRERGLAMRPGQIERESRGERGCQYV